MKNSIIVLCGIVVLSLSSCQDVIDIELRDADRKYVIEGSVVQGVDSVVVRVSRTTSFFDTAGPEAIADAVVKLTLADGTDRVLEHVAEGYYKVMGISTTSNATYRLNVQVDGETFTASAFMPEPVAIDSLTFRPVQNFFGPPPQGPPKFNVFLNFQDPASRNYYRAVYTRNGNAQDKLGDIQLFDDELTNGNYIEIPIFNQEYKLGDTAYVALQTMDVEVYTFLETFVSAASADAGSPFSAAPDNPISNIEG
ncbi:MAG: DUF4249 family protein, partial [Flavobacteriales bacterium]